MNKFLLLAILVIFSGTVYAQKEPKGLEVQTKAPVFFAKDQNGKTVHLKDVLKKGPVVLVFYRGQWCPYCNRQLKKLEDSLSFVTSTGATLLAISPEVTENISKTIKKTNASYPILHDEGLKIMKAYDVAFDVDEKTIERYKRFNIDFNVANGKNGARLPVPAVYVINRDGTIVYRHFDPDYRNRASVAEILKYL